MIDIYDRVFGTVYRAAVGAEPTVTVQDAHIPVTSSLPCVTVLEMNNSTDGVRIGSRTREHAARVSYQIDIYASTANDNAQRLCRAIMANVSDALIASNFEREMSYSTPNYADGTLYRLTGRFRVIADAQNKTYRR